MKRALVVAALMLPLLVLAADRLNVKTGLWEVTSITLMQGAPPIPADVLAKMSPEQRAKMEAMFASRAEKPRTHVSKECITEEDLQEPFKPDQEENCTTKVVKSSANSQEFELNCTGKHVSHGTMRIDTPTPESMTGKLQVEIENEGKAMTLNTQLKGRWLGASCKGADE